MRSWASPRFFAVIARRLMADGENTPREEDPDVKIDGLDHLVLTVRSFQRTIAFYQVLGMEPVTFDDGRRALRFGRHKINLHEAGHGFEPRADHPVPGSADLCFLTETPLAEVLATLAAAAIPVIEGPVERTGAVGQLRSVYVRDPDGNLIELANQVFDPDANRG